MGAHPALGALVVVDAQGTVPRHVVTEKAKMSTETTMALELKIVSPRWALALEPSLCVPAPPAFADAHPRAALVHVHADAGGAQVEAHVALAAVAWNQFLEHDF